jgi:hypothetical protein
VVINLLVALAAGEHHLLGVDDDDVVAVVDMGREGRLVLAAQAHGDDRRQAADDQALGVDEQPFLLDVGRLGRMGVAEHELRSVSRVTLRPRAAGRSGPRLYGRAWAFVNRDTPESTRYW